MPYYCSKEEEEALARLFYNVSSSLKLAFIFLSLLSISLAKLFHFVGLNPIFPRSRSNDQYEFTSSEEEEEEEEVQERSFDDHLVADIIRGGESLLFLPNDVVYAQTLSDNAVQNLRSEDLFVSPQESIVEEEEEEEEEEEDIDRNNATELFSMHETDLSGSESEYDNNINNNIHVVEKIPARVNGKNNADSLRDSVTIDLRNNGNKFAGSDRIICEDYGYDDEININESMKVDTKFSGDEKFLSIGPTQLGTAKKYHQVMMKEKEIIHDNHRNHDRRDDDDDDDDDDEEVYGDSCTVGSTSKSSSDWRSSINYRDSGTDQDPFSSSSRRSCPKWVSYTVFQKYDEEMMFLDRISAQKLHETESLRSIKVSPRSVSERILHKLSTVNKTPKDVRRNPYHELEAAYVAQICLTWEALNWNYKNFQQKRALCGDFDLGCPARIAQQFQQFQVLLQRYVENEPYEQGRRPEVYARVRLLAPKLLQVPEYRDSEDNQRDNEGNMASRISSPAFLIIMEDCIHTFMNFLKADKEKACRFIASLFTRKRRGSVDPTLLHLMKKVNQKKKMKLKDLRRARKCLRKRRSNMNDGMEIVMGLIDLKVVSRVLRMKELNEEQMHWCEEKMSKVRILDGKLQRDSLPLFFPAH